MSELSGRDQAVATPRFGGVSQAVWLTMVSAAGRAPSYVVPLLIAGVYGAAATTDAYFVAYSTVLFIAGTLAQGVEYAIVPFAARETNRAGTAARGSVDVTAARVMLIGSLMWGIAAPVAVWWVGPGLRGATFWFAGILSVFALAWCGAAVFAGALVSQSRIAASTGSMLWRGVGGLLGLAAAPWAGGLTAVAVGLGAGEVARLVWLRRVFRRSIPDGVPGRARGLGGFGRAAAAQAGASAATGATPVVERVLAVSLGVGSVSHLEYAYRLWLLPGLVFEGALAPLLLARWSAQVARGGELPSWFELRRILGAGMTLAALGALLLGALAPALVLPLVRFGRFTLSDAEAVVPLVRILCFGFIATMGALLIERFYLASLRNRTLAVLSVLRMGLRLGIIYALLEKHGLAAFGIGYAVADWTYFTALIAFRVPRGGTPVAVSATAAESS